MFRKGYCNVSQRLNAVINCHIKERLHKDTTTEEVIARVAKAVFFISWLVLGLTQALIGFLNNGQCNKTKHLPMYLGIHGIINGVCGIIAMPCYLIVHRRFYARLIFYTFWGMNGILILYGLIQSGVTHANILSCIQNCESCADVVSLGTLLYFFGSIISVAHECRTPGSFCQRDSEIQNRTSHDPANQDQRPKGSIPSAPPAYSSVVSNSFDMVGHI